MVMSAYQIVIIGAGPGGISLAVEAIKSGISPEKIVILEKAKEHSFSIRKFYPEKKLVTANYKGNSAICKGVMCLQDSSKNEALSYLDKAIADYNIRVNYSESVWKIEKKDDGRFVIATDKSEYESEVCVIAIGMMGRPNKLSCKVPATIRQRVHYDITSDPLKDCDVLVIGGGDSASEYVQYLNQENNKVTLSYRREEFTRMNDINKKSLLALEEREEVDILLESNVKELGGEDKVAVTFAEEKYATRYYDHLVLALGGSTPHNFLKLLDIEFNQEMPVLKEGFETSVERLFLVGDISAGKKGGSIVTAFNSSHDAMAKICNDYLSCKI